MRSRKPAVGLLVLGPGGNLLRFRELPSAKNRRWTPARKAEVIAAVRGGLLPLEDARQRYDLTIEEYGSWERHLEAHGLEGLCVSKLQRYRH